MQCCGYMHTVVLCVLCMLLDHGIATYRTRTLKGSVNLMCGHRTGPCGFHRAWQHPYDCVCGNCKPVRMPYTGLGISVWSVMVRECTFVLHLPGRTWLCATWPVGTSTAPTRQPTGLLPAQNRRKTAQLSDTGNTAPVRVQTFSKSRAGLHGMPCHYPRVLTVWPLWGPELPESYMWPRHKTSNARVTWVLRVVSGP